MLDHRRTHTDALLRAAVLGALAATAAGQQQFAELARQGFPPSPSQAGNSDAVYGDFDGDGDLDMISLPAPPPPAFLANDGRGNFTDASSGRFTGVPFGASRVLAADFDGDGDEDLLFGGNGLAGGDEIHLNDGAGSFTRAPDATLPASAIFAIGDVDGDSDIDVLFGFPGQQEQLYLNNGDATFVDATLTNLPPSSLQTTQIVVGDVTGDGAPDVVLVAPQIGVWINGGSGQFADESAQRVPPAQAVPFGATLADLDGDGDRDLALANGLQPDTILWNDGTGHFQPGISLPSTNDTTYGVVAGDLEGDGDLDLVFANDGFGGEQNRIYRNDGSGTFTDVTDRLPRRRTHGTKVLLADINLDGILDLFDVQESKLFFSTVSGAYADATAERMHSDDRKADVVLADLDGDTDLDAFIANQIRKRLDVLLVNDGSGVMTDETGARLPFTNVGTVAAAGGDVDADGDIDIVVSYGTMGLLENDGGTFQDVSASRMPAVSPVSDVELADIDSDGDLDVVATDGNTAQFVLLNDGSGSFVDSSAGRIRPRSGRWADVELADVDRDGDADLLLVGTPCWLMLNDGSGRFTVSSGFPVRNAGTVRFGDVDQDGDLDAVVGGNELLLNDGSGAFTPVVAGRFPSAAYDTRDVEFGDVDEDGDLDVVVGNFTNQGRYSPSGQNRLYLNDGSGAFTDVSARLPAAEDGTFELVLGDVDADGDVDILVGNNLDRDRLLFNLTRQLDAPGLLRIGSPYTLDVYARTGSAAATSAVALLSTGTASIALPPLGTFGLDPDTAVVLPTLTVPQPAGMGSLTFVVPNVLALAGLPIHTQAVVVQAGAPRLTNVMSDRVLL